MEHTGITGAYRALQRDERETCGAQKQQLISDAKHLHQQYVWQAKAAIADLVLMTVHSVHASLRCPCGCQLMVKDDRCMKCVACNKPATWDWSVCQKVDQILSRLPTFDQCVKSIEQQQHNAVVVQDQLYLHPPEGDLVPHAQQTADDNTLPQSEPDNLQNQHLKPQDRQYVSPVSHENWHPLCDQIASNQDDVDMADNTGPDEAPQREGEEELIQLDPQILDATLHLYWRYLHEIQAKITDLTGMTTRVVQYKDVCDCGCLIMVMEQDSLKCVFCSKPTAWDQYMCQHVDRILDQIPTFDQCLNIIEQQLAEHPVNGERGLLNHHDD